MPEPLSRTSPTSRVAVVTGASGGIGRATVRELADRGWDVGLLARGDAGLTAAVGEVEARGRRALAVPTDVADAAGVEDAAAKIEEALGPIEVWINNAMTTAFARIRDLDPEEIARATDVTYLGQVHGALAALRRMQERDRGTIVFVGSALAYRGIPLQSAYCAAKFATRGFYESLRCELLHEGSGVRVSTVHLPAVDTPQFGWCRAKVETHPQPVPPIYRPEVAAAAIVDAAETAPRQKILGTWNWVVVHLAQWLPGVADHYMARSGVDGQLTDTPIDEDRPDNLFEPVDGERDHGAHGIFGHRSGGALTPAFLRSMPELGRVLAASVRDRVGEVRARR